MRRYYANRLDYVLGQVESVLLAGSSVRGVDSSPDGKWLFVDIPVADDIPRPGMMNMDTYQIYPLDVPQGGGPVWIDNHHYKLGSRIIRVSDMFTWVLKVYYLTQVAIWLEKITLRYNFGTQDDFSQHPE
jgi:hypothetical protein